MIPSEFNHVQKRNIKCAKLNLWSFDRWVCVKICEQIAVYITFSTNTAAAGASLIAVKGSEAFQWVKVCDKFKRFCVQIGGAFLCGYVASILMALVSTISAYKVFRMYSPKGFLRLKRTWSLLLSFKGYFVFCKLFLFIVFWKLSSMMQNIYDETSEEKLVKFVVKWF